eukprot:s1797_g12.t1
MDFKCFNALEPAIPLANEVQAHVVSLLGKDKHGEPGKPDSHILADEPEAELDAPEGEEMWNMDWSAVTASQTQQEVA